MYVHMYVYIYMYIVFLLTMICELLIFFFAVIKICVLEFNKYVKIFDKNENKNLKLKKGLHEEKKNLFAKINKM